MNTRGKNELEPIFFYLPFALNWYKFVLFVFHFVTSLLVKESVSGLLQTNTVLLGEHSSKVYL